jgi:hypothetical protein
MPAPTIARLTMAVLMIALLTVAALTVTILTVAVALLRARKDGGAHQQGCHRCGQGRRLGHLAARGARRHRHPLLFSAEGFTLTPPPIPTPSHPPSPPLPHPHPTRTFILIRRAPTPRPSSTGSRALPTRTPHSWAASCRRCCEGGPSSRTAMPRTRRAAPCCCGGAAPSSGRARVDTSAVYTIDRGPRPALGCESSRLVVLISPLLTLSLPQTHAMRAEL